MSKPAAQRSKDWRSRNPDKVKAYTKRYNIENADKIKHNNALRKDRGYYGGMTQGYANSAIGWARYKAASLRNSAKRRGHRIDISYLELIPLMVDICPVSGVRLDYSLGSRKGKILPESPSVDRIDNSRGYEIGNIIIVSQLVNKVKHNLSLEDIQSLLPKIIKFYKGYIYD